MADDVISLARGTAYFGRKVNLGNYESAECGIHVQFEYDPNNTDDATLIEMAKDAVFKAKTVVFDELKLEAVYDTEAKALHEVARKFEAKVEPQAQARAAHPAGGGSRPAASDGSACPKCGGEMWDNRQNKRNPKSPDFKCKDQSCGKGVWTTPYQG